MKKKLKSQKQNELKDKLICCKFALETARVLAERNMFPGPKLLEEWKKIVDSI